MKNKLFKIISTTSAILLTTTIATLSACSLFIFDDDANTTSSNNGILENNIVINPNTRYLNNRSISLKFLLPKDSRTKDVVFGTGWIFDFEKENNYIKTFYIATNIHVVNLVSATTRDVELYLGKYDTKDQQNYPYKAIFESPAIAKNKGFVYKKDLLSRRDVETNQTKNGSFSILPIGLNNQIDNYLDNPNANNLINKRDTNNLTTANDFAIIKLNVNTLWSDIPALRDFDEEIGIGLGSIKHQATFYSAGYPHIQTTNIRERATAWKQYANTTGDLLNSFQDKNYRSDNPVVFGYNNINYVSEASQAMLEKKYATVYDSYDFANKSFNLGSGASGSPIVDAHNNFVGIYWGGFMIQEGFNRSKAFYGNFTPIFVDNKNKTQDILHKYLVYTSEINSKTYLDSNFNTNINIDELKQTHQDYFNEVIDNIIKTNPELDNKIAEINKTSDLQKNEVFDNFFNLFWNYIKQNQVVNSNYYLDRINYDDILKIVVSRNTNKNIALKISFVSKQNYNFDATKTTDFNTTFTFYKYN